MVQVLESFVRGSWTKGQGRGQLLVNPATEEPMAEASTEGLDFAATLDFARRVGGSRLRAMSYAERGELLTAMSRVVHQHRDGLLELAMANGGNTRSDAKFDLDGCSGTLAYYGALGKELGDRKVLLDEPAIQLGRSPRFVGQHAFVPRRGVAVHVNAFNFPAWGLGEKAACALLAGMPVVAKPATSTALVAYRIVQLWVDAALLPEGALQLVVGAPGDLLHHLGGEDVLSFTGGGSTAAELRALAPIVRDSVRVNVEADSLNAAVLGADVELGSDTFLAFVRDVTRDITQKTGQKCTAIRRVLVPREKLDELRDALVERLTDVVVGDPASEGVTMGPVATAKQLRDVRAGIERLRAESRCAFGDAALTPRGVPEGKGFFVSPTLLVQEGDDGGRAVHEHEVFGPVATLIGYEGTEQAIELVRRGGGGLVTSLYTDDRSVGGELVLGLASAHGRLVLGSAKVVEQIPGPGTVLPQTIHGGPGRAGGGEELGGRRGLAFYAQRVAVQGDRPMLEAILGT